MHEVADASTGPAEALNRRPSPAERVPGNDLLALVSSSEDRWCLELICGPSVSTTATDYTYTQYQRTGLVLKAKGWLR